MSISTGQASCTRLTAKQEAFIVDYVFSAKHNATQSAIKAGYSPKTAYSIAEENLRKPEIMARRAELEAQIVTAKMMPERERREKLADIARETHFMPVTAGDRIRAIDTLNKLDKLYADGSTNINFNEIKILVVYEERKKPELEK